MDLKTYKQTHMKETRKFQQVEASEGKVYKQYEYDYRVIRPQFLIADKAYVDFVREEFNKLGQEGWEVIRFDTIDQGGTCTVAWVKRLTGLKTDTETYITQTE